MLSLTPTSSEVNAKSQVSVDSVAKIHWRGKSHGNSRSHPNTFRGTHSHTWKRYFKNPQSNSCRKIPKRNINIIIVLVSILSICINFHCVVSLFIFVTNFRFYKVTSASKNKISRCERRKIFIYNDLSKVYCLKLIGS